MSASFFSPRSRAGGRVRGGDSTGGSFIIDGQGTVLGFDEGMEKITGWPATDVVGHPRRSGRCVETRDSTERRFVTLPLFEGDAPMPRAGSRTLEMKLFCRDGSRAQVEAIVERLDVPGERLLVRVLRVLARSSAPAATAGHGVDDLTGLLDRESFLARLESGMSDAKRNSKPLAVILADVDHLREINGRFGHEHGNEVLRKLAGILRVGVGECAAIARIDADDFAILLPDAGRGDARQVAAGLRSTVERFRFFPDDAAARGRRITLSLGAASFPADAEGARDLLERAYDALDEARSFGRNRVWCYLRRPRVPVEVPVYFDAAESLLVGYSRDLSPSGIFVQTSAPIDIGMRCALAFSLPGEGDKVQVIGRVVRAVPPETGPERARVPGMGVEFERFSGPEDRRALDSFLHRNESATLRPEDGTFSV